MKICILGPITTKKNYGGVAVFDEALNEGFTHIGCEVTLCSNQSLDEVQPNLNFRHISFWNVNRVMEDEKPELIISSLAYAKYYPFIRYKCIRAHFLHGFFNITHYGIPKAMLGWIYQKLFAERCDRIYSNSSFTYMVNQDILGLRVDKTVLIGVTEKIIMLAQQKQELIARTNRKLLYAGRLTKSKKIDTAIQAVRQLHQEGVNCIFEIVGDGPEMKKLVKLASGDDQIIFTGRINQDCLFQKERNAEVFLSLCPSESYGMAFVEALLAGCKIICPQTGGQNERLMYYRERIIQVDAMQRDSVTEGIRAALSLQPPALSTSGFKQHFSYDQTAAAILRDVNEMNDWH